MEIFIIYIFVIIHFRKGAREKWGIDFQYLLGMINDSFMSSPTSIVVNGGKMGFAMELILSEMRTRSFIPLVVATVMKASGLSSNG